MEKRVPNLLLHIVFGQVRKLMDDNPLELLLRQSGWPSTMPDQSASSRRTPSGIQAHSNILSGSLSRAFNQCRVEGILRGSRRRAWVR